MMKRLYNYLIISSLLVLLASCGTDLEPEIFPNRMITNTHFASMDYSYLKKVFVSDSKIYFYSVDIGCLVTYDLSTRETAEMEIQIEGGESVSGPVYTEDEYRTRLLDNLSNISSLTPGGAFWYNGKGYVVTQDCAYVFSPETSSWTYYGINFNQYNGGSGTSNFVLIDNRLVQISDSYMYYFSPESMTWEKEPMTRLFRDLSANRTTLFAGDGGTLYASDYYERVLYTYNPETKLWQEVELNMTAMSGDLSYLLINGNFVYLWISNYSNYHTSLWEVDLSKSTDNVTLINFSPEFESQVSYSDFSIFNIGNTCYNFCYDNYGSWGMFEFKLR